MSETIKVQLAVLGAGPGGYTAAFRAADLGLDVALIERHQTLGGVCLNVGCIPSKALLHAAEIITESARATSIGVAFGDANIDLQKIREWKTGIVTRLTGGLAALAKKRQVQIIRGDGKFLSPNEIGVQAGGGNKTIKNKTIKFEQAIIAAGSSPTTIPGLPAHDAVFNSTGALALNDIPQKLLVVGGGIIGLEMATVYHALGARVSIVEMADGLIAGADADLVRPLYKKIAKQYDNIWLSTKVVKTEIIGDAKTHDRIKVTFENNTDHKQFDHVFDKALIAVGRAPNSGNLGCDAAGVMINENGFIAADAQQRTNVKHIFAIGDVIGNPMLAHKAAHEGKVAAEVAAGMKSGFDARVIPSVAYTNPEIAWVGLTERDAKRDGVDYGKGVFPWAASGRALTQGADGATKLLFDNADGRLLGAGIVGAHAGELIAQAALAIEMNADAEDVALTIHPHPTLAETVGFAAESFAGTLTDLYQPKRAAKKS